MASCVGIGTDIPRAMRAGESTVAGAAHQRASARQIRRSYGWEPRDSRWLASLAPITVEKIVLTILRGMHQQRQPGQEEEQKGHQ